VGIDPPRLSQFRISSSSGEAHLAAATTLWGAAARAVASLAAVWQRRRGVAAAALTAAPLLVLRHRRGVVWQLWRHLGRHQHALRGGFGLGAVAIRWPIWRCDG
jgi:hypothetical protein